MGNWEVIEVIAFLLSLFATVLGLLTVITKPSRDNTRELTDQIRAQQSVLTDLQITITRLNIILEKVNEQDRNRDARMDRHDDRINQNKDAIVVLQNTHFKKNYTEETGL